MQPNREVASTFELTGRQLELLKTAAKSGNENRVREFLRRKPRLDNQIGGEILWGAVLNDHFEIASMLVEAGVDVNVTKPKDDDWTHFLHELVINSNDDQRNLQLAVLMMEHGANVNAVDCYCFTPLRYAIRADSPIVMIRELLKHGAHVDSRLVFEAADHSKARELMVLLVGHFVKTETRSRMVHDVLYYCADVGFDKAKASSAVKLLLDMRIPVVKEVMSQTLVAAVRMENIQMVQLLIDLGLDVNGPTPDGSCAIHLACREESLENIKVLLRHGADLQVTDREGRTPFSLMDLTGPIIAAHKVVIQYLTIGDDKINDRDLTIIEGRAEARLYYSVCLRELERMKLTKIMNDFSLYSVFKNVRVLAFLARYPSFFEIYNGVQLRDEFPIYRDEMDFALERAKTWKNLLSEREKATCETLKNAVPHVPLERIILYLYLNDIE